MADAATPPPGDAVDRARQLLSPTRSETEVKNFAGAITAGDAGERAVDLAMAEAERLGSRQFPGTGDCLTISVGRLRTILRGALQSERTAAASQAQDTITALRRDLSEWHEIAGMVQEALGAAPNDPSTWIAPMNFDTAIRSNIKHQRDEAASQARRETLLECADIAKKHRSEAEIERHNLGLR